MSLDKQMERLAEPLLDSCFDCLTWSGRNVGVIVGLFAVAGEDLLIELFEMSQAG